MPESRAFTLLLLPGKVAVSRLSPLDTVPSWARTGGFTSITRTADELSIVCSEAAVPRGVKTENGWRVLKIEGPFEFSEVGILLAVIRPLNEAGISILSLSTFDTDYVLVKQDRLEDAVATLTAAGHRVKR